MNVVTLDSRILKLDSIRLGAGGAGKPRAYSYASPTQGGGSATATASSGNSANSTYMDLKHDANTWIRFETYGGRGGGGADCHAELNSDHANYGNGAYAGSLGAIQISIEGRSYQSQIIPPASSGNNMIISLDGYGNVSSDWTSSDGRASLKFTTSSIKLSTIDESTYLEIYWTPEFGRKGSNGDSSGGGGTSGSYLNGRFGGIGGNYNSSSANGTSDAYVYWDVYRDSLDVTVISAIDYNTSTVTYSKPTKFPQIRYDGQWKTIKGGSVWDGTNWKRIGGNLYSYSTGTFY